MPKKEISWILKARDSVTGVLRRVGKRFRKFGQLGKSIGRKFALGIGVVSAALAGLAYKGQQFRKQIALIKTMTDMPFATISRQIRAITAEFGQTKEAIASGIYDALSAGVPKENVFEFVRVASKAAVGGATDTAVAVDAMTSVLNAYSMDASEAAHVSDVLFTIVKDGKIRYAELAMQIGKLGPTAKAAGVSLEELAAYSAALVQVEKPERAFTALRNSMMIAAKQGKTLDQVLAGLEGAGLEEILKAGYGQETAGSLSILTGNMEAVRREMERMKHTAGEAGRAFSEFDKANLLDRLWQSLSNIIAVLGDVTLELFESSMRTAYDLALSISDEIAAWKNSDAFKNIKARVDGIIEALKESSSEDRKLVLEASGEVIKASFAVAAETAVDILRRAAKPLGTILGAAAKGAFKPVGLPGMKEWETAREQLNIEPELVGKKFGITVKKFTAEQRRRVAAQVRENRLSAELQALGLEQTAETENQTAAQVRLNSALDDMSALVDQINSKRKKGAEDTKKEEQETAEEKPLPKPEPKPEEPPGMAEDVEAKIGSLKMQIRLQELLNKGKNKEAELLRVQQSLGRDLTEQERERLGAEIDRLNALKGEQETMSNLSKAISVDPGQIGTSLAQIGGMIGAGGVENREAVQLDKRRNSTLDSINSNIRRLEFDMEMT